MKKALLIIGIVLIVIVLGLTICYWQKEKIISHILSNDFHVPVRIEKIEIKKDRILIKNFFMGNPKNSKTKQSLFCKEIDSHLTLKELRQDVLTIDSITASGIELGVEFYDKRGNKNNWAEILKEQDNNSKSKNKEPKHYLIRKLELNSLTVTLTQADGKYQTFPTIDNLVFYNISDETGFPIDEIEKAIFYTVLKSVFQRFNLLNLIESINPATWLPKILPFF